MPAFSISTCPFGGKHLTRLGHSPSGEVQMISRESSSQMNPRCRCWLFVEPWRVLDEKSLALPDGWW